LTEVQRIKAEGEIAFGFSVFDGVKPMRNSELCDYAIF